MSTSFSNKDRSLYLQHYLNTLKQNSSKKIIKIQFLHHLEKLSSKEHRIKWYLELAKIYVVESPQEALKYCQMALGLDKKNESTLLLIKKIHHMKEKPSSTTDENWSERSQSTKMASPDAKKLTSMEYTQGSHKTRTKTSIKLGEKVETLELKSEPESSEMPKKDASFSDSAKAKTIVGRPMNFHLSSLSQFKKDPLITEENESKEDFSLELNELNEINEDKNDDKEMVAELKDVSSIDENDFLQDLGYDDKDFISDNAAIEELSAAPALSEVSSDFIDSEPSAINESISEELSEEEMLSPPSPAEMFDSEEDKKGSDLLVQYLEAMIVGGQSHLVLVILSSIAAATDIVPPVSLRKKTVQVYLKANQDLGRYTAPMTEDVIAQLSEEQELDNWRQLLQTVALPTHEYAVLL